MPRRARSFRRPPSSTSVTLPSSLDPAGTTTSLPARRSRVTRARTGSSTFAVVVETPCLDLDADHGVGGDGHVLQTTHGRGRRCGLVDRGAAGQRVRARGARTGVAGRPSIVAGGAAVTRRPRVARRTVARRLCDVDVGGGRSLRRWRRARRLYFRGAASSRRTAAAGLVCTGAGASMGVAAVGPPPVGARRGPPARRRSAGGGRATRGLRSAGGCRPRSLQPGPL